MEIPGISSSDIAPTELGETRFGAQDLDRDAFLNLFVAQLKNQDPLEPVKNEAFVEQLATFSSLEQLEEMNDNMLVSIALNQSNAILSQLTGSSDLIGKEVNWTNPETGYEGTGTVDRVKLVDGLAVLSVDGQNIPLATITDILGEGSSSTDEETNA